MLDTLTAADFREHLNETFNLSTGEVAFDAELIEASESGRPRGGRSGAVSGFSLLFAGPADAPAAAQGTFAVSHPAMGTLEVFLVPLQPREDGRPLYEAVFN